MQMAGYHHANHLADQLRQDIERRDNDLLTVIQSAMETASVPPSMAPSEISLQTPPAQQQANSVRGDPIQMEMLKLLQQMQQMMTNQTSTQGNNNRTGNSDNNNRDRRRQPQKTPDDATFNRYNTSKYCWTHGACNHDSNQCRAKAQGHQDSATLDNRKGGSNAFCSA